MNHFRRILIGKIFKEKPASGEKIDLCAGCVWKELKRHQKCSTCRRNQNMKDNYEPVQAAQEGGVERE